VPPICGGSEFQKYENKKIKKVFSPFYTLHMHCSNPEYSSSSITYYALTLKRKTPRHAKPYLAQMVGKTMKHISTVRVTPSHVDQTPMQVQMR
jgi:hypothetical protein